MEHNIEENLKAFTNALGVMEKTMPSMMDGIVKSIEKTMTPEQAIELKKRLESVGNIDIASNDLFASVNKLNNLKNKWK